jgi:hypothetical protein
VSDHRADAMDHACRAVPVAVTIDVPTLGQAKGFVAILLHHRRQL